MTTKTPIDGKLSEWSQCIDGKAKRTYCSKEDPVKDATLPMTFRQGAKSNKILYMQTKERDEFSKTHKAWNELLRPLSKKQMLKK